MTLVVYVCIKNHFIPMTAIDKNLTHNTKELAIWHWMRKEPTLCFHPLEDKVLILVTSAIRQNISIFLFQSNQSI